MHPAAFEWVKQFSTNARLSVLDIGSRNVNGTVRDLFPAASEYVGIDLYPGSGVDVVGDVTQWFDEGVFDLVVCCEVLEHAANWKDIIATARARLRDGGTFVVTCAGPGRHEHSGHDGAWQLHEGEHYANISPSELEAELEKTGWTSFTVNQLGEDVRCVAVR